MATEGSIRGSGWTRLREIGRGASGVKVTLAVDKASGELFVVKSAPGDDAALLRECRLMFELSSPYVLRCFGFETDGTCGERRTFLEFATGGSLADAARRHGRGLEESTVRAYAADMLRGLSYIHGLDVAHGDLKGSNVLIGSDGRAKLADFGCARTASDLERRPFGGTPAFMAPEVARGEAQGPAADVWALGCTVIELSTGYAPWRDTDNVLAVMRRIGYTEAVPAVAPWLSAEAKDFLDKCFRRQAGDRWTAAQLLKHPFVVASTELMKEGERKAMWVSPTSTLDGGLWQSGSSDTEDDVENDMPDSPVARIKEMACCRSFLPDWCSDDGWIEVHGGRFSDVHDLGF